MSRDEIQTKITDMMVETFELDRDKVTPSAQLYDDLELDSIDALDMVVKLQELMPRRVKEDEMRALRTVGDVVDMVLRACAEPAEAPQASGAEQPETTSPTTS